jgi:antitoxin component of RelBE/YafQ-DinJ toxin-antitoxin module
MPTLKQRLNITTDRATRSILERIAKRDNVPLATKAAQLLRNALELEEDIALANIANERFLKGGKFIPHELAWK